LARLTHFVQVIPPKGVAKPVRGVVESISLDRSRCRPFFGSLNAIAVSPTNANRESPVPPAFDANGMNAKEVVQT